MILKKVPESKNLKFIIVCLCVFFVVSLNFYFLNKVIENSKPTLKIENNKLNN
jgi:hypothetical protein